MQAAWTAARFAADVSSGFLSASSHHVFAAASCRASQNDTSVAISCVPLL